MLAYSARTTSAGDTSPSSTAARFTRTAYSSA